MRETIIKHPRLRVERRAGWEGHKYDPDRFEELHVFTPRGDTILHDGLATWIRHNHKEWPADGLTYEAYAAACRGWIFEACTGYSLLQIMRIARKLGERCCHCGSRQGKTTERGYPGEYLVVCVACKQITGGYFREEEIE